MDKNTVAYVELLDQQKDVAKTAIYTYLDLSTMTFELTGIRDGLLVDVTIRVRKAE